MQWNIRRTVSVSGLAGTILIVLGSFITAMAFKGSAGESYSFLNHYISELGEVGVSQWAMVFNVGMVLGGLCLTVFMLALARYLGGWFGLVFGFVGLIMGVSGALVGVFPMNNMIVHKRVALTFFRMGLIATGLFSTYVPLVHQDKFPMWLAIPGALTVLCFFGFLYVTSTMPPGTALEILDASVRPHVMMAAIWEWAVFFTVLLWVAVVSLYLRGLDKNLARG